MKTQVLITIYRYVFPG